MTASAPGYNDRRGTAIYLALVAGYVDGYALRALKNYVSFMSGNTTYAGLEAGQGRLMAVVAPGVAIVGFLAGSFTGSWIANSKYRFARRLLLGVSAALLALFVGLGAHNTLNANLEIGILSSAMGLLNPAVSRVGSEALSLTFVTGTLNKIAGHLALAAHGERPGDAVGAGDTHLRRAALEASVWAGFLAGAVFSGLVALWLGRFSLVPACGVLIGVAFLSRET